MLIQILDTSYSCYQGTDPVVHLFGSTPSGKKVTCDVVGFLPYFYVDPGDCPAVAVQAKLLKMAFVIRVEIVDRYAPIGYQSVPRKMLKVFTQDPRNVRDLREKVFEIPEIKAAYETDILFKNRFLIDKKLGGMDWAEVPTLGECIHSDAIHHVQQDSNAPLRMMSFDIECLPKNGEMPIAKTSPVIMISMAFEPEHNGLKTLVLVGKSMSCSRDDTQACSDEYDMLNRFAHIIQDYDPDILAGYNSNEFDIPYLVKRAEILGLDMRVGRDNRTWYMRETPKATHISVTGRVIVDLLPIIRSSFSLKQYTLRNVSAELLKMEKLDVEAKEIEGLWFDGGAGLNRLISYARRDSVLAMRLLSDLRLMDKFIALSKASGLLLQDVVNGGQSGMVENLLLRRFGERGRVVPPKPDGEVSDKRFIENQDLKGGSVLAPEKGLVEDVVILDYKSLYPTIMMAHNLCYSTVVLGDVPAGEKLIVSPAGGRFVQHKTFAGIVPGVLAELLDQRIKTKKLMKTASDEERRFLDAKQYAMKILLNSFYGYSGYARARLYSLAVANAVTSFGRENIARTQRIINETKSMFIVGGQVMLSEEVPANCANAKRFDLSVVYGDTDSVFVHLKSSSTITPSEAELIGKSLAALITSSLPEPMELVFEAFARRGIFLAKKRYALWIFEPSGNGWKDKIKVRGIETVRRDWCNLTSKTIMKCLELILKEGKIDEAVNHARDVVSRVRNIDPAADPSILEDLTLTRKYGRSVDSYKNKQPHIELVKKIKARGGQVPDIGDRVPFVIVRPLECKHGGSFVESAEDPAYAVARKIPIDSDYYINKQILPPVLRIFESFGVTGERLTRKYMTSTPASAFKPKNQASLIDF